MKSKTLHVAHGGHSGDIVYSLPFAKYLSDLHKAKLTYHVISNRPASFPEGIVHPNGSQFNMNGNSYEFIKPLLQSQNYIAAVKFTSLEELPSEALKLDYFREIPALNEGSGNMQLWARKFFGININTEESWIKIPSKPKNIIVCAFSRRYRNIRIKYHFLDKYTSIFIGLKDEYEHFKNVNDLKNLTHAKISNALDMAALIKDSRFFIGNQSFAFSIAEGLKVNRALEVCEICPNVIPSGKGAHDFLNTNALKNILASNNLNYYNEKTELNCEFRSYYE